MDARELASQYMRLVDGFVTTQLLYVAASLDVGGRLAGGPMSGPDLAAAVGVDHAALARVLRGLVAEGVLDEPSRHVPRVPGLHGRTRHDWNDADARRIMANCRAAMPPGARLLVVEAILPERARDAPEVIRMDLHMMILLGARERTEAEFRRLLGDAGFTVQRVVRIASSTGLGIVEAVAESPAATSTESR